MADLEQRVTTLERAMTALKTRVGANEEDVASIPDLIKVEFRLGKQPDRPLSRDMALLQGDVAERQLGGAAASGGGIGH